MGSIAGSGPGSRAVRASRSMRTERAVLATRSAWARTSSVRGIGGKGGTGDSSGGAPRIHLVSRETADRVESLLSGLNPPQREAVEHGDGPLLILAGAGSGKGGVLSPRVAPRVL